MNEGMKDGKSLIINKLIIYNKRNTNIPETLSVDEKPGGIDGSFVESTAGAWAESAVSSFSLVDLRFPESETGFCVTCNDVESEPEEAVEDTFVKIALGACGWPIDLSAFFAVASDSWVCSIKNCCLSASNCCRCCSSCWNTNKDKLVGSFDCY